MERQQREAEAEATRKYYLDVKTQQRDAKIRYERVDFVVCLCFERCLSRCCAPAVRRVACDAGVAGKVWRFVQFSQKVQKEYARFSVGGFRNAHCVIRHVRAGFRYIRLAFTI